MATVATSFETGAAAATAKPAASWGAIIAGAFVAAGASVILLALGSGLGFSSVSPWSDRGVSATTFTVTAAIWLLVTQWVSAGLGGYIAGRLRNRWIGTHTHEVFFRDTAHGLVTWAVATVLITVSVASSLTSAASGGLHAVAGAASTAAQGAATAAAASPGSSMTPTYAIDKLFRSANTEAGGPGADPKVEAGRIVANAVTSGNVPDADRAYLAQLVAARAGIDPAEAQRRVDDFIAGTFAAENKAKAEADAARKSAAEASLYLALSLLVGAFIASVAAAMGGRLRDEHV